MDETRAITPQDRETPPALADELLSRIEDAGINASAPPQQRWMDGWILRFNPGKAKRARCINAVAEGRIGLDTKLALAAQAYRSAGLPMIFRVTRFSHPSNLDASLAARGYTPLDDTRVMVCPRLSSDPARDLPAGMRWAALDPCAYAEAVGAFRGSPADQRRAHAERLSSSPVTYRGHAIRQGPDGPVLACGQYACEAELVGLYDIHTHVEFRGRGLARILCERLLALSMLEGARTAYLQVEADNHAARSVYHALGFADAYAYHYRVGPEAHAAAN